MKLRQFLILSLAANVVLLAFVLFTSKKSATVAEEPLPFAENSGESAVMGKNNARLAARVRAQLESSLPGQLDWREIQSADYKIYIENLRRIECPEQTIRDIITSKINKTVAAKRSAIRRGGEEFVFWKPDVEFNDYYPKLRQERALEREKSALLKELFGTDPNEEARRVAGTYEYMEWQYDFLTGDKRAKAREIQELYVDMGRELKSAGSTDPEVQRKVRGLYEDRLLELAKYLTPDEVEEYDLCSSSLSESMRSSLDGFEPTADEFRKIYRIKKSISASGDSAMEAEAIRQLLGEKRYAEYVRAQDRNYRELYRLSIARDLPSDTAQKVWEIKTLVESAMEETRQDATLAPDQKRDAMRNRREEAKASIQQLLGERNYLIYRSRGAANWIEALGRQL